MKVTLEQQEEGDDVHEEDWEMEVSYLGIKAKFLIDSFFFIKKNNNKVT